MWQLDAACTTSDSAIFEYDEDKGLEYNINNFSAAAKICATCPVLDMCASTATEDDRIYTFRAGARPREAGRRNSARLRTPEEQELELRRERLCLNGHIWTPSRKKYAARQGCPVCRLQAQVRRRAERKALGLPYQ